MQTAAGAAHAALEHSKRKRQEKLRRERAAAKKRDDEDAALCEKNKPLVDASLKKEGGAGLVGWRVRVFWKAENAWFYGTVKAFDAVSGKHAVSYDAHGPCSPSANETRPHVTEHEKPVDAYTLRPAGVPISTLPNSLCHWPTFTATTAPRSAALRCPAACSEE